MIKELSNFIQSLDPAFKNIGLKPKDGLHILLSIQEQGGEIFLDDSSLTQWAFTRKKDQQPAAETFLKKSAFLQQYSWNLNTNKCFDLPIKAIHSCSPYCIALKRENLSAGEKYRQNIKSQVYERISSYFEKTSQLTDSEEDKKRIKIFEQAMNSEEKFNHWLSLIPEYKEIKDSEYIIIYLDEPIEKFQEANAKYLADKLFNTNEHNKQYQGSVYGTSDFFNGYPAKKPFLTHQTATFDIASRITAEEAKDLYDFQQLLSRNILPKPLPIFIYQEELGKRSISLFKKEAEKGFKAGYREIFEELHRDLKTQIGNYYLLYYDRGVINDFDYVSTFRYQVENGPGKVWNIVDHFNIGYTRVIENVFQLELAVLQPIFNNYLVTQSKDNNIQRKYFEELDPSYAKSEATYLLAQQYRKAFYDYIYKSRQQSLTKEMFDHILQTSILEDIRLDKIKNSYNIEEKSILEKMNIWFSLSEKFNLSNDKKNIPMAKKLQDYREFIEKLIVGQAQITTDEQYAFSVGQVIAYLRKKSNSADKSYKILEPFLQQVYSLEMNKSISRMFDTYKHETFSRNFSRPFAEVMAYETEANLRNLMPILLAGIFSENKLFANTEKEE